MAHVCFGEGFVAQADVGMGCGVAGTGRLVTLSAGLAALDVAAHRGKPRLEPSDDVEAVKHMAGMSEVGVDGGLVGLWIR